MKQNERLFEEWFAKEYGPLHASGHTISKRAYLEGFRKARKLALEIVRTDDSPATSIADMGEQET